MSEHQTITPVAGRAEVDAARLLLARLGLSPADLLAASSERPPAPTFAEYVPVVAAAVAAGTSRVYGSYWNRVVQQWGQRRIDEPTPSELRQLVEHVKAHVVARRNARGGRCAGEHLIAALRCVYRHAEDDGFIRAADNPARKVDKPRRLPTTRRAVPDARWPRSTTSPPPPATTRSWTACCCDCTPKPRFVLLQRIPYDRTAERVAIQLAQAVGRLPESLRRSVTWDQGVEMAGHAEFTVETNVPVYFCDPH